MRFLVATLLALSISTLAFAHGSGGHAVPRGSVPHNVAPRVAPRFPEGKGIPRGYRYFPRIYVGPGRIILFGYYGGYPYCVVDGDPYNLYMCPPNIVVY